MKALLLAATSPHRSWSRHPPPERPASSLAVAAAHEQAAVAQHRSVHRRARPSRSRAFRAIRTSSTWAASRAAFGRAPTTASAGRTSPTERFRASRVRSARWRWRRRIPTSSTPAPARPTFAAISTPATASTRRPTPARRGRTPGLRDTHMIAKIVDRSAQSERRLCGLDGPRLQAQPRARRLQDDRRRSDVEEGSLRRRQDRRRRSRRWTRAIPTCSTRRCGRRSACRGSSTSGGPAAGSTRRPTAARIGRRFRRNPGFATGTLGKIGVSVAASNPRVVYAIVQARDGGVFRSDDAGATWKRVNDEMKLRQRAFYYMAIFADPTNPQVAYVPEVDGVFKTKDGGKTFTRARSAARRQSHHLDQSAQSEDLARRQRRRRDRFGRRRRHLEQRAQSADGSILSRRPRRSVSVPRLRRRAGRRRIRRTERATLVPASVPAIGIPSPSARARSSRRSPEAHT